MSIRTASRALPGVLVLLSAGAAQATVLSDWNLMVKNGLTSTSEVEGRTAVGGNVGGTASNYGIKLTPASSYLGTDVLVVGGNITAQNINMSAGNVRLGGTSVGVNINQNGGGTTIHDATAASQVSNLFAQVTGISTFLAGLAPTNGVVFPGAQPAGVTFNCVPNAGVAVFNITAAQLFANNKVQSIDINLNGATSVIINVTGSSPSWDAGNFVGNFNADFARSHTLWNFVDATNVNWTSGRTLSGSILAPNADMSFTGTIEGSAYVKSLTQNGEVHLHRYEGYAPTPGALGLIGAAGLMGSRRRR